MDEAAPPPPEPPELPAEGPAPATPPAEFFPPLPRSRGPKPFGPLYGFLVFLAFLGAQVVVGIGFGIAVMLSRGMRSSGSIEDAIGEALPALLLLGLSASGAGALLTARLLVGKPLRGPAGEAFGIRPASATQILWGIGAGLALGAVLIALVRILPPPPVVTTFSKVAGTPVGYWSLLAVALLLAPPIEEFTFRGAFYTGLCARMPPAAAALIVTGVFTLMHAGELAHYWPGFVIIALMSLVAIVLRVRTGSLLPAVAAHFAYNFCAVAQPWF